MSNEKDTQLKELMLSQYMLLREQGLKNIAIAKKFGVTKWSLYYYLPLVADKYNVPRESLLDKKTVCVDSPKKSYKVPKTILSCDDEQKDDSFLHEINAFLADLRGWITNMESISKEAQEFQQSF